MPPSEVSREDWICRFITPGKWDDDLQQPTPQAFMASDRHLSVFHPNRVIDAGDTLQNLCIAQLSGAGEAHLQVETCIRLGQGISDEFNPKVHWRPDKVGAEWEQWKDAHAHIESSAGNSVFPTSYRSLLAENATCLRPPDSP